MSTHPLPKASKSRVRDTIRSSIGRVKQAIRPVPHSSHPNPESGTFTTPGYSSQPVTALQPVGQVNPPPELSNNPAYATSLDAAFRSPQGPGSVARSGLETMLRVLEKGLDVFPPLKSAVSEFAACLEVINAAAESHEEYEELTSELTDTVSILNQYVKELGSEDRGGSMAYIARTVQIEVEYINKQRERGKARRVFESANDREDMIKRYRRIEVLFRQLQNDLGLRTWQNTDKQFKMMLLRGMSPADDARYNSSYSTTIRRRGCTLETREKVQADLQGWVRDPNAAKVYWMNGMAGTGKTTIAYSLCEWLEGQFQLGASFFCSRASSACRDVNRIVPTIAYQLARYSLAFRSALCRTLEEDPDADRLNVVRQFEKLIQEPMKEIQGAIPGGVVVVIDALDECEDNCGMQMVLQVLLRLVVELPLKFFVTSRPEPAICNNMLSTGGYSPSVLHLHDIEQSIVEEDIKKYLVEALGSLSPPPSNDQIEQLAKRAGKLFIYAATVTRYILPKSVSADSSARLNTILETPPQVAREERPSRKYIELDGLYLAILAAAFKSQELEDHELEAMMLVLRTTVCAREPMTTQALASLLGLTGKQVVLALQPLMSVVHLSVGNQLVSCLHASFPDYMHNQLRSGAFYCDEQLHSQFLAGRCFTLMKEQLRFNICRLESSLMFDINVPSLAARVEELISPALFYACRYWGEHLQLASFSDVLNNQLVDFLTGRLLFWMEVLNLRKCIGMGGLILRHAQSWSSTGHALSTHRKIIDARNFITQFAANACSRSTPHIYISALPICPKSSFVYANYWRRTHGLIDMKGTAIDQKEPALLATWHTCEVVNSVAISPNGTRIVSEGKRGGIRVRDAHTGAIMLEPPERHKSWIRSITFSPDGTRIASGSVDCTILVWDAYTGDVVAGPFEGHTELVSSVVFSPDGTQVISGSWDRTIRVWSVYTGAAVIESLEGHTYSISSVTFSSDGTRIVSGSNDCTIRLWDACTGAAIAPPFKGHTSRINSVAFSPDDTQIVSCSDDCTIRVWDAHSGDVVVGPLKGHTRSVNSVAFSPNGVHIVSGSNDCTIQVWDVHAGTVVAGPFKEHEGGIKSVTFSHEGAYIVSGSEDRTIRVWDASASKNLNLTGTPRPVGHTRDIRSIALSPDDARIVSGSLDSTILVWDMLSGAVITGPLEGHTDSIYSVTFSPNGAHIASGSGDRTIRLWDSHTGDVLVRPFEGHASSVSSVAFSPDGARVVSGSDDHTVRVWDAYIGVAIATFCGHSFWVRSVSFSPDGARVLSSSSDCTVRVWNVSAGEVATELEKHTDAVNSASFSPDGSCIVSGSADKTVIVWDAHTGSILAGPLEGHTNSVQSVAFSPESTLVASGSRDNTVRVWDAHTGDLVAGPFEGHTHWVNSVAFSRDCAHVVSGSGDRFIRVWAVRDRFVPRFFEGQIKTNPITLSPNTISTVPTESTARTTNLNLKHHPSKSPVWTPEFKYHDDGWITADNQPFFWTPQELHQFLPYPPHPLVISPKGSIRIDNQDLMLGDNWAECYMSL